MPPLDMDNLRPGDKVVIRPDLFDGKQYGMSSAVGSMPMHKGKTMTIRSQLSANGHYLLLEDKESWSWSKEMFEGGYSKQEVDLSDVPF